MKRIYRDVIITIVLVAVIPALLFGASPSENLDDICDETTTDPMNAEAIPEVVTLLHADGRIRKIQMEEYVLGVVLMEMPASFEMEALKAQSVVARTYAIKREKGNMKHQEANLCTDPKCCQGYCTTDEYLSMGGSFADIQKVQKAVSDTAGEVITYEKELIDATYFSCSGGITEDAEAVWGQDVPYLQSVTSPGEENATHFTDTVTIPFDDFQFLLGQKLTGKPNTWIKDVRYTNGDGVATLKLEGVTYTGTEFRQKLGLRSTAFEIRMTDNAVVITTKGYGHRVGMSQYGADAMAASGSSYKEIIQHYYVGTEITTYSHND